MYDKIPVKKPDDHEESIISTLLMLDFGLKIVSLQNI
ncbi:Uncharacterised protein [Elizabethkingia meningoseptica]|nr:Uncharacterised protein [Elizabethkingia meningoseptica]